jgi:hypothetical protein
MKQATINFLNKCSLVQFNSQSEFESSTDLDLEFNLDLFCKNPGYIVSIMSIFNHFSLLKKLTSLSLKFNGFRSPWLFNQIIKKLDDKSISTILNQLQAFTVCWKVKNINSLRFYPWDHQNIPLGFDQEVAEINTDFIRQCDEKSNVFSRIGFKLSSLEKLELNFSVDPSYQFYNLPLTVTTFLANLPKKNILKILTLNLINLNIALPANQLAHLFAEEHIENQAEIGLMGEFFNPTEPIALFNHIEPQAEELPILLFNNEEIIDALVGQESFATENLNNFLTQCTELNTLSLNTEQLEASTYDVLRTIIPELKTLCKLAITLKNELRFDLLRILGLNPKLTSYSVSIIYTNSSQLKINEEEYNNFMRSLGQSTNLINLILDFSRIYNFPRHLLGSVENLYKNKRLESLELSRNLTSAANPFLQNNFTLQKYSCSVSDKNTATLEKEYLARNLGKLEQALLPFNQSRGQESLRVQEILYTYLYNNRQKFSIADCLIFDRIILNYVINPYNKEKANYGYCLTMLSIGMTKIRSVNALIQLTEDNMKHILSFLTYKDVSNVQAVTGGLFFTERKKAECHKVISTELKRKDEHARKEREENSQRSKKLRIS